MWADNEDGPAEESTLVTKNFMYGGAGDDWMKGSAGKDEIFGDDVD